MTIWEQITKYALCPHDDRKGLEPDMCVRCKTEWQCALLEARGSLELYLSVLIRQLQTGRLP